VKTVFFGGKGSIFGIPRRMGKAIQEMSAVIEKGVSPAD
jgi:hypothetical protein